MPILSFYFLSLYLLSSGLRSQYKCRIKSFVEKKFTTVMKMIKLEMNNHASFKLCVSLKINVSIFLKRPED